MSKRTNIGPCSVDGCDRNAQKRGMCTKHYDRVRRTGTTDCWTDLSVEERFMNNVIVDDGCWEWVGYRNSDGYGKMKINTVEIYAHRISYELFVEQIPGGLFMDHICGVRHCVNPDHLRLATKKQNNQHKVGLDVRNKTGFRGVYQRADGTFTGQVRHEDRAYSKAGFKTAEEAGQWCADKRAELYDFPDFTGEVA